jgi:hypothetical protein
VVVVDPSCLGGGSGWTKGAVAPFDGGGHTMDLVMGDPPPSGSLSLDLGAGVLMGLPCALTWIRTIYLGAGLSSESSTEKISMGVFIIFFIIIGIPFSSLPLSQ